MIGTIYPVDHKILFHQGFLYMTAHQFFKETFNLNFNDFIDPIISTFVGEPVIDVIKFDDWLHKEHGNYEERGLSMQDFLTEQYGQEVTNKIKELLG
jgi:hypothetical protein